MLKINLPQIPFSKIVRAVVEFELIDNGGRFKSGGTAVTSNVMKFLAHRHA